MTSKCAACISESTEEKAKLGIIPCAGCNHSFCLNHLIEHRKTLSNQLDAIGMQQDALRSRIEEIVDKLSKEYIEAIDDWKQNMLQKVVHADGNARQQVPALIMSELGGQCTSLTDKIITFQRNDNYFETDLEELQAQVDQFDRELLQPSIRHRVVLDLATMDCMNMVKIKPFEQSAPLEKQKIEIVPTKPYNSFIQQFLTRHPPSVRVEAPIYKHQCASPAILITVDNRQLHRLVLSRLTNSSFNYESNDVLDMIWSFHLQQFIIHKKQQIDALDPVEKEVKTVVSGIDSELHQVVCWKYQCLTVDIDNRVFLYQTSKTMSKWFLLYCWSKPVSCKAQETISAIGLNDHHIALVVGHENQYSFVLRDHQMQHPSSVILAHPCTTIQVLPNEQWLLYHPIAPRYVVMDGNLQQHDESDSIPADSKCIITCAEDEKLLMVLLPVANRVKQTKSALSIYYSSY